MKKNVENLLSSFAKIRRFYANELQNKIFKKLESKSGFQKADFAISLLYKDDFVDLVAPVYIQEGLEWMKSYLDSNGNRNGE